MKNGGHIVTKREFISKLGWLGPKKSRKVTSKNYIKTNSYKANKRFKGILEFICMSTIFGRLLALQFDGTDYRLYNDKIDSLIKLQRKRLFKEKKSTFKIT